jgi:regulator of sirC expression with transglutaminase-like and TPR domain
MPAYCHAAAHVAFAREMPRLEQDSEHLFRAACAIALHEHPEADVDRAWNAIQELGITVANRVHSVDPQARLAHLHDVLFDIVGFRGNNEDYYNPANSYVPAVLDTHRGIPITLVLIYKCVAEQIGLEARGINSPGHFLASVLCPEPGRPSGHGAQWMFVDPFYGGELLTQADVYNRISESTGRREPPSPVSLSVATHKQWLARMLHNLQAIFAQTGRERDLYAMQELEALLEKEHANENEA